MGSSFEFFRNIDIFGASIPSFNLGGKQYIKTWTGAISTLIIFMLLVLFGSMKLDHLLRRSNPIINTFWTPLDEQAKYELNHDFMGAYAAENTFTGEGMSDERYLRWLTAVWDRVGTEFKITWYPMHRCTDEDFSKFHPAKTD